MPPPLRATQHFSVPSANASADGLKRPAKQPLSRVKIWNTFVLKKATLLCVILTHVKKNRGGQPLSTTVRDSV